MSKSKGIKGIILNNPIPDSITDSGKVRQFFQKFGSGENRIIMPAFGNNIRTAHTCQKVINELYNGSTSAQACANCLIKYSIGGEMGDVDVVRSRKAGRKRKGESKPLTEKEDEDFDNWFEGLGLNFTDFAQLSCELEKNNFIPSGNHYLRVRLAEVNGEWSCTLKVESYLTTAPIARKNNGDRRYLATVEDNWELYDGKKIGVSTASEVGKDFDWEEVGKGIYETIIHYKNRDSFSYYGRTPLITIINHLYSEWQKGNQSAKVERVATVAKYLLETPEEPVTLPDYSTCETGADKCSKCNGEGCGETDPVNNREKSMADGLRNLSTNEGDEPHDIVVDFYSEEENGGPSTLHKFDVLRDSKWLIASSKELRNIIHATGFNIPAELTKMEKLSGGLNSEQLLIMLIDTEEAVVKPVRTRWHNYFTHLIAEIAKKTGRPDMARFGIEFEDKIGNVIAKIKEIRNAKGNAVTDQRHTEDSGGDE